MKSKEIIYVINYKKTAKSMICGLTIMALRFRLMTLRPGVSAGLPNIKFCNYSTLFASVCQVNLWKFLLFYSINENMQS